jgi:hypothetical protein
MVVEGWGGLGRGEELILFPLSEIHILPFPHLLR